MVLDKLIDILAPVAPSVRILVVRNIIKPMLVNKFLGDGPWRVGHDLVYPSTMPHALAPFNVGHDCRRLVLLDELVRTDTHDQVYSRERKFSLAEL